MHCLWHLGLWSSLSLICWQVLITFNPNIRVDPKGAWLCPTGLKASFTSICANAENAFSSRLQCQETDCSCQASHSGSTHPGKDGSHTQVNQLRFPANPGYHSNRMSPSAIESKGIEVPGSLETVIIDWEAPWHRVGLPSLPYAFLCF